MQNLRWRGILALGLAVGVLPVAASAQSQRVTIDTVDGVRLQGTYYPGGKGKDYPCVMLLHDFDAKKGGNRAQDGWDSLATALQTKGYTVLSFDFRGHGDSTSVEKSFWNARHNQRLVSGFRVASPPETISHTSFNALYYPFLVNDIAAAKAYLDRKNDTGEINTSNLVVIGAGEGATLGAMWMASEWFRRKATIVPGELVVRPYPLCPLDEPEGRDQVCGVWLTISPTLAGRQVPIRRWITELGDEHKVAQVFLYGEEDTRGKQVAQALLTSINSGFANGKRPRDPAFAFFGDYAIKGTSLKGSQLLQKNLETEAWIVEKYLEPLRDKRATNEIRDRNFARSTYYWIFGRSGIRASDPTVSDKAPLVLPLPPMGIPFTP